MYSEIFAGLVVTCIAVRSTQCVFESKQSGSKDSDGPDQRFPDFKYFQLNYLIVYLFATAADCSRALMSMLSTQSTDTVKRKSVSSLQLASAHLPFFVPSSAQWPTNAGES